MGSQSLSQVTVSTKCTWGELRQTVSEIRNMPKTNPAFALCTNKCGDAPSTSGFVDSVGSHKGIVVPSDLHTIYISPPLMKYGRKQKWAHAHRGWKDERTLHSVETKAEKISSDTTSRSTAPLLPTPLSQKEVVSDYDEFTTPDTTKRKLPSQTPPIAPEQVSYPLNYFRRFVTFT